MNCFSWVSIPIFLRKPIVTYELPGVVVQGGGGGPDPLSTTLATRMVFQGILLILKFREGFTIVKTLKYIFTILENRKWGTVEPHITHNLKRGKLAPSGAKN